MKNNLQVPPEQMSPLVLAYVGDAVFEVFVREHLISAGITKVKELHKQAVKFVNATTQAKIIHALDARLSQEELSVVKRGRNAKSGTVPKNMDMIDYRYGTAFEALIGYLYLQGRMERLEEVFAIAIEVVDKDC